MLSPAQFIALMLVTLRTRYLRRRLMFWVTLGTMLTVTLSTILASPERPLLFALSWLFCFILVLLMIMLALYDMLSTPREIREEAERENAREKEQMPD